MDYYSIGQRIRKFRKARNYSQEFLAEKIGVSVTHMSHIETGNTKLSLPVLYNLACLLEVRTDDLLFDAPPSERDSSLDAILQLLGSCNTQQLRILEDILRSAKSSLDKYL